MCQCAIKSNDDCSYKNIDRTEMKIEFKMLENSGKRCNNLEQLPYNHYFKLLVIT